MAFIFRPIPSLTLFVYALLSLLAPFFILFLMLSFLLNKVLMGSAYNLYVWVFSLFISFFVIRRSYFLSLSHTPCNVCPSSYTVAAFWSGRFDSLHFYTYCSLFIQLIRIFLYIYTHTHTFSLWVSFIHNAVYSEWARFLVHMQAHFNGSQ